MERFLQVLVAITLAHQVGTEGDQWCSRVQSRMAHSILEKTVLPIMKQEGLDFGSECPLQPRRNMYHDNERRKWSEVSNHWNCLYCGKSFFSERFMDHHMESRHQDTIVKGPQAVCLADHCDYLRCDVIANNKKSSFWEEALCRHNELDALRKKCQDIVKQCLPSQLTGPEKYELKAKLEDSLCSYLTCEKYWENQFEESSPERVAAYIIATIFTVFGFIMYYTMACSHLYNDDTYLLNADGQQSQRPNMKDRRRNVSHPTSAGQSMRNRQGTLNDRLLAVESEKLPVVYQRPAAFQDR